MSATIVEFDNTKYYKFVGDPITNEYGQEERKIFYAQVPSESALSQLEEASATVIDVPRTQDNGEATLTAEAANLLADALGE